MAIASLLIMGFGYWTYNQSVYDNKVKEYFSSRKITPFNQLKTISSLSDRLVIVKGEIFSDENFLSKSGKKVVLERFQEETKDKNSIKDWKIDKESKFFKVLPFWLKEKSESSSTLNHTTSKPDKSSKVLIDAYAFDKTFLGFPETKTEEVNTQLKRISTWQLSPGQTVYVMGNIENKGGQLIINSPGLYKEGFNPFTPKVPFIITSFSVLQIINKANELAKGVYYVSLALFAVGVFFLLNSIKNIMQTYHKIQTGEN